MVESRDLAELAKRSDAPSLQPWWGEYRLPEGCNGLVWRIGPLHLQARCWPHEWRLSWRSDGDPLDATVGFEPVDDVDETGCDVARYAFRETGPGVTLLPRVADRSVVVRPDQPLYVPAGESVEIFVSTVAWIEIRAIGHDGLPGAVLSDMPAYRPTDSWFGPNTREGELCYASRSLARLQLVDVIQRPHRILSPVTVRNRGDDHLFIERLNVPMPLLAVHASVNGQLWTQPAVMERGKDGGQGSLKLDESTLPAELGATRLSEPREASGRQGLFRTLDRLFG